MQETKIGTNEAGQRLDKYLQKYMPLAPVSFFYKMLRKKNITLNGKKAKGNEKLAYGDRVSFFLSEETIQGFKKEAGKTGEYEDAFCRLKGISVVYEDDHILVMNKPPGILSQKAEAGDLSLNEWMIGYLLKNGTLEKSQLATYKPSVCNRLDRNTCGLVIGAKSLPGSQMISRLMGARAIGKYYQMLVKGHVEREETLEGYLVKDEKTNRVWLAQQGAGGAYIQTRYYPVRHFFDRTLVEARLITGKPHQIRIHLTQAGHPLLGDYKYGDKKWNDGYKNKYGITSQLLCACRLEFPPMEAPFEDLSRKIITAPLPEIFQKLMMEDRKA